MDIRERDYATALAAAGMDAADAAELAGIRAGRFSFTSDWDVRTLKAGVPGGVLLEWARADVPFSLVPEALENGARLEDLLELAPEQVAELAYVSPFAARMNVRLTDVASLLAAVRCRRLTAIHALAIGFTAADLAATERLGVNFAVHDGDEASELWNVPAGCLVDGSFGPQVRILALVIAVRREVNMEAALAIAAGCTEVEAEVMTRLVLDGQHLPDVVRATRALLRDSAVPAERTPQVRLTRGVEPTGR